VLKSASSLPELQAQLEHVNGEMPWTSANSIVSELVSKGASNVVGCRSQAVTSMTRQSAFYHSMISLGGGYLYSTDAHPPLPAAPMSTLPTANIAMIGHPSTRTFAVEGALIDDVTIGNVVCTEDQLLDMVVGATSCLAPSLKHIIRSRCNAHFLVLAARSPLRGLSEMQRVRAEGSAAGSECRTTRALSRVHARPAQADYLQCAATSPSLAQHCRDARLAPGLHGPEHCHAWEELPVLFSADSSHGCSLRRHSPKRPACDAPGRLSPHRLAPRRFLPRRCPPHRCPPHRRPPQRHPSYRRRGPPGSM